MYCDTSAAWHSGVYAEASKIVHGVHVVGSTCSASVSFTRVFTRALNPMTPVPAVRMPAKTTITILEVKRFALGGFDYKLNHFHFFIHYYSSLSAFN